MNSPSTSRNRSTDDSNTKREVVNFPLAYTIAEACAATRTSRTALYDAINSGQLRAVKRRRRTLILAEDLRSWITRFPSFEVTPADQSRRPRFYLAVPKGLVRRSCGICAFVPPIPRQNPPGTPKLQARQDKSRNVRPRRRTEVRQYIMALPRCAVLSRNVRIRKSAAASAPLSPRAVRPDRDRKSSRRRALFGPFVFAVG